ncbi:MAG: hypothetical protein M1814_001560 [Vezdaea aestivalis]|nr:MAG: hypothetical protein M1814_001560 [Vezdaea aestivalis]
MVQRYTSDQLLRLKESPLVSKPSNLPPLDEWMGNQPDHSNQRKATSARVKSEDALPFDQTRRTPAYEAKSVARTPGTAPEDIVLGPPKLAFSSAMPSRGATKPVETSDRRKVMSHRDGADSTMRGLDGYRDHSQRERNDKPTSDKDKLRDPRLGTNGNRKGTRDETEGWTSVKTRRSFGQEDADRVTRRIGDREHRDGQEKTRGFESHNRDREGDRENRRSGVGRARNEATWFRDTDGSISRTKDTREHTPRDQHKDREWRERDGLHTRDWSRNGAVEKEPEWMDEPASTEKQVAHTQEDFQRWKEKMKAGNSGTNEPKPDPTQETSAAQQSAFEARKLTQKSSTPLILDNSEDGFFRMWNQNKEHSEANSTQHPAELQKAKARVGPAKASRFTSFFTPTTEPAKPMTPPKIEPAFLNQNAMASMGNSEDQDKEGFARIMQMLGNTNLSTPQPQFSQQAQPAQRREHDYRTEFVHADGSEEASRPPHIPQHGFQQPSTQRDSEFLQELLFQGGAPRNGRPPSPGDEGAMPFPKGLPLSQPQNQQPNSYDDVPDYGSRPQDQSGRQAPPSILRRPPGLDAPPPGWVNSAGPPQQHQQPPQQQSQPPHGIGPPPGLPNAPNRGPNGPFPPFHPPPGIYPGDMGLPPGFFMGPPPGYPPMGFPPGMMPPNVPQSTRGQVQGLYDIFGEGRGIPPPDR